MVLDIAKPKDYYIDIATFLSKELAESAVERDAKAGPPEEEINRLRSAGLLSLVVPKKYGGIGATWIDALKIVQELSKSDGSIGQLYGNHLNLTALGHVSGTPAQKERYYQATAQNNWFWGNAINTRDTRLKISPDGENFRINGVKSFGTGINVADLRVFSALEDGVSFGYPSKQQSGLQTKPPKRYKLHGKKIQPLPMRKGGKLRSQFLQPKA
jgi:alkylation response protein AidB-like acyl-CoA dehydrogenase